MANEEFSLCWDNFHSNMSSGLSSLLKTEDLVDVTLAAEGRYLKAHKMVLSVCSPYFRELFQVNPCQHPIVFLKDVSFSALSNLLEFMYHGEVKVSQDDLGTFIKTAEALKIKGLTGENSTSSDTETNPKMPNNVHAAEPQAPPPVKNQMIRDKTPPTRKKPLGPASKRLRMETEHLQAPPAIETPPKHVIEKQLIQLKMEPEESAVALIDDEDAQYDDTAIDEAALDNSTDYMLDTAAEMDMSGMNASTSGQITTSEATAENQGLYKFVVTQAGTLNLALHQHLYRPRKLLTGGKRFWVCTWRDHYCPALCVSTGGKLISRKGMHNHTSQRNLIVQKEMDGYVCYKKKLF